MKKFHKVLLVLVGVIVLAVVVFKAMQPKEPEYQGRKLSEWMANASRNPAIVNPAANEALYAMRHEALPIIEKNLLNLEHIGKASSWKKRMWDWQIKYKIGANHTWWHHYDSNFGALRVLGTNAIPVLKRLAEDSPYSYDCISMLVQVHALEEIAGLLQNGNVETRRAAALHMQWVVINPERAVQPLAHAIEDADRQVVQFALISLRRLKVPPELVMQEYRRALHHANWWTRCTAAEWSEEFGTNAQPLVPVLLKLQSDPDLRVQRAAANSRQGLHQNHGINTNVAIAGP